MGITSSTAVVTPTATSIYTVVGTNSVCANTQTVQVVVNPTPTVNITSSNYTICNTGNAILTGSGASTYTWQPCTGTCTTSLKVFSPTVTTVYTLTGTNAQGCIGSKTFTVVVVPIPTITVNSATICAGSSATLTASGSNTYTWSPIASNASKIMDVTLLLQKQQL
jgi:hypothetical protein